MNIKKISQRHYDLLKKIKSFLDKNDFKRESPSGLLQPRFNYTFSPSAGHNIVDDIVVSRKDPYFPVLGFYILPERSIRISDLGSIGISRRHLSLFELLVFGYVGAAEDLPKEKSVELMCELMLDVLGLDKEKLLITVFGSCEAEGIVLTKEEDGVFYKEYIKYLGEKRVFRTIGQMNLFYSRVVGNPGSTGCEIYYKIGNEYIEIGSHVNYKFRFTGKLKRTRNQAILEGFGFERLLMALENKEDIYDTSLICPLKEVLLDYFRNRDKHGINLFRESFDIITDHIRAISFIIFDGQRLDQSSRGRILKKFIKNMHVQFIYLGIKEIDEFRIINRLVDVLIVLFSERYRGFSKSKTQIINFIKRVISAK